MEILPPLLKQGHFWYKADESDQTLQAIKIMEVTAEEYYNREWRHTYTIGT
jgi:hypothetical protein